MPKPAELPTFATTLANRLKPVAGALASGFLAGQRPPPRWVNWLLGTTGDWLTWFDESTERLRPSLTAFTTVGSTVWNPPAGLVFADIVLIGGGQCGTDGGSGFGSKGGEGAVPIKASLPASIITGALTVVVGNSGQTNAQRGEPSRITLGGATLLWAPGGGPNDVGTWPSDVVSPDILAAVSALKTQGGSGGTAAAGTRGHHSGYGPGGAGGATGNRGGNGFGYGAGGGGGRNSGGTASGGGGGGGGYGLAQPDGAGGGTSSGIGLPGQRGACFICAWRDVNA